MERTAWVWMPVAALLVGWAGPRIGVAQAPAPPAPPPAARALPELPASTPSPRAPEAPRGNPVPPAAPITPPSPAAPEAPRGVAAPSGPILAEPPGEPEEPRESVGSGGATRFAANPLATNLTMKTPEVLSNDFRFPINLATALKLADARPLIVAAAQAGVWMAEAELTRAKVLWIPTFNFGFDYLRHDGGGPDFNKGIMTAPSVNFFYGGGGMWGALNAADIIYQPLAARQVLNAAHFRIQTAKNDALLQTADAYFQVHQYRGMFAGALYCVERGKDLVERINQLSKEFVPKVEVDRARNMLADLEQRSVSNRQQWRVNSANLTQVLRLDPRAVIVPQEHDHAQITLIDPGRSLDDLMAVALTNRPELGAHQGLVQASLAELRAAKARPFLPTLMINGFQTPYEMIQAGIFGIGPNSSLNQWKGRLDLSYQPLWQLQSFGIGNLAGIKTARGLQSLAIIEFFKTQDMVAADCTRALARVQSAAARVLQADRALRTAIITFNGTFEGLRQTTRLGNVLVLVNRPQEAVFALQLMNLAFDEYFTTVSDYNRAQFELFHALGYPAREVAALRTTGELLPVDLNRPAFLPPVGNGPPPATR